MTRMLCLLAAALLAAGGVRAQTSIVQTQTPSSPVAEVQRLAPQLVPFAGGEVNFANLVNGLTLGLPVTLTTPLSPGVTQVVSFTPVGTMSALQAAQLLETARQSAIANGIAAPTAQQIAVILNGGALPTASGMTPQSGLVPGAAVGSPAVSATVQTQQTQTSPAVQVQQQRSFTLSNSPFPRGISDTPTAPAVATPTTPLAIPSTPLTIPGTPLATPGTPLATPGTPLATPEAAPAAAGASAGATRTPPLPPRMLDR